MPSGWPCDYEVVVSPDRDELVRWLESWRDKGFGLMGPIQVAEIGEGNTTFVATLVKPPPTAVAGPQGLPGEDGTDGKDGAAGLQGPPGVALGVVWRYNVGALPGVQRQVIPANTFVDIIPSASVPYTSGHWYAYKLTGQVAFDTMNSGADIRIQHAGVDFETMWQIRAPGQAPSYFRFTGWSRTWQATSNSVNLKLAMRRTVGNGTITLDQSAWLEVIDMGATVPPPD